MSKELNIGDRIMLYHMEDEFMAPGIKGTVVSISRDPFEDGNKIIGVKWDNGSTLNILSKYDFWKKIGNSPMNESADKQSQFIIDNEQIFRNFDINTIRQFLLDLRNSGIVNMYASSPFLYMGSDKIVQQHGSPYDLDLDDARFEAYERVVEQADTVKNKVIEGTMRMWDAQGNEWDLSRFERKVQDSARKLVAMYMVFF